jgi:hypothetical protein
MSRPTHTFPFPLKPQRLQGGTVVDLHHGRWPTDLDAFWVTTRLNLPQHDSHGHPLAMADWLTYFFVDGWTRRPRQASLPEPPLTPGAHLIQESGMTWLFRYVAVPEALGQAFDQEVKRHKVSRATACLDYIRWSVRQHLLVWRKPARWVQEGLTADTRTALAAATPAQRHNAAVAALEHHQPAVLKHLLTLEPALTQHVTAWTIQAAQQGASANLLTTLILLAPVTPWLDRLAPASLMRVGQVLLGHATARKRVLQQTVTTPAARGLLQMLGTASPRRPTPKTARTASKTSRVPKRAGARQPPKAKKA